MTVSWYTTAEQQLMQTVDYIFEHSSQAAEKFGNDIRAAANSLAAQPKKAPREPFQTNKHKEYRGLIVRKHYKIIYYVDEATDTVNVALFWDQRQNPQRLKNWFGRLRLFF